MSTTILDLIKEYERHADEATSLKERTDFFETILKLDEFRACFEQDFPGERVRICLVVDD